MFLVSLVWLVILASAAVYVFRDATNRDKSNAHLWTAATVLGFLLGFLPGFFVLVLYVLFR